MTDIHTPYPVHAPENNHRSLWQFSQRLYAEPGIETLCLHLQDTQSLNVLLLLWGAWLEVRGQKLSPALLTDAQAMVAAQSQPTVAKLRAVRQYIKHHELLPADVERQVKQDILSAEIAIEKQLLLELEALAETAKLAERRVAGAQLPLDCLVQDGGLIMAGEWLRTLRAAAKTVYASDERH